MARIIVLDSQPLIDLTKPRGQDAADMARNRLSIILARGDMVAVPEIADYEARRSVMWARHRRLRGKPRHDDLAELRRLNKLKSTLMYIPLTTAALLWASDAWGELRSRGLQGEDVKELGADAILAGQAATAFGSHNDVWVASDNDRHFRHFTGITVVKWASVDLLPRLDTEL